MRKILLLCFMLVSCANQQPAYIPTSYQAIDNQPSLDQLVSIDDRLNDCDQLKKPGTYEKYERCRETVAESLSDDDEDMTAVLRTLGAQQISFAKKADKQKMVVTQFDAGEKKIAHDNLSLFSALGTQERLKNEAAQQASQTVIPSPEIPVAPYNPPYNPLAETMNAASNYYKQRSQYYASQPSYTPSYSPPVQRTMQTHCSYNNGGMFYQPSINCSSY